MKILFYLIFFLIAFFIFNFIKYSKLKLSKNLIVTFLCTLLILNIVLKPEICLKSALDGAKLFIDSVFVSLFPFLVLINIMLHYDGVNIYSKFLGRFLCKPLRLPEQCSVVLIISTLCGYPLGSKYACELYERKIIDFKTCERLLNIASNPSPLFILGAVGTSMLNNPSMGLLLLISSYLSCAIMGLILPSNKKSISHSYLYRNAIHTTKVTLGDILKLSIDNAIKTSVSIGGFIIFFSVLTAIIKNNIFFDIVFQKISLIFNIEKSLLQSFFLGLLEMTNGCSLISNLNFDIMYKIIILSFLISFSGLSIISQTYSITYKYNFSLRLYISRKLTQGFICSIISVILYKFNIFNLSKSTFNVGMLNNKGLSLNIIFAIEILLILFPIITQKLFRRIS